MTPHQFAMIAVRLFVLMGAIHVAKTLIGPGAMLIQQADNEMLLYSIIIPSAFLAIVLASLWFCAAGVANRLIPRTGHTNHMTVTADALARAGCGLIGLWLTVQSAGDLLWYAHSALTSSSSVPFIRSLTPEERFSLLLLVAEVVAGIALIFCAGRFSSVILRDSEEDV